MKRTVQQTINPTNPAKATMGYDHVKNYYNAFYILDWDAAIHAKTLTHHHNGEQGS